MDSDTIITVIPKDNERYVYVWNESSRAELLRTFGRQAANPDLAFSWWDAAVASQKIRGTECAGR
jgi:hypothetical protein